MVAALMELAETPPLAVMRLEKVEAPETVRVPVAERVAPVMVPVVEMVVLELMEPPVMEPEATMLAGVVTPL